MPTSWPASDSELVAAQLRLGLADDGAEPWGMPPPGAPGPLTAGCFVAYAAGQAGPGNPGDQAWAAAVLWRAPPAGVRSMRPRQPDRVLVGTGPGGPRRANDVEGQAVVRGRVEAAYRPGLLALREGPLLEEAVRALPAPPEVLLVDATGRDHARRAGLAVHLGAVLGLPTVGVTHRPLLADGPMPPWQRGATAPLEIGGEVVAAWVCTRTGVRPVVAHAGWRTGLETAVAVAVACSGEGARTPAPLGEARRVAREARALAEGRWQAGPRGAPRPLR
ncbi:MAG TPA: endonuclease V [Acidimicrobiales bacterium]|nr:endonuclease V [Acidimicrobiales bacterium]